MYLYHNEMRFDDVCLILNLDVKLWSRLHLLVNTAHTQKQKHRRCHKGQSLERGCCCTAAAVTPLL